MNYINIYMMQIVFLVVELELTSHDDDDDFILNQHYNFT